MDDKFLEAKPNTTEIDEVAIKDRLKAMISAVNNKSSTETKPITPGFSNNPSQELISKTTAAENTMPEWKDVSDGRVLAVDNKNALDSMSELNTMLDRRIKTATPNLMSRGNVGTSIVPGDIAQYYNTSMGLGSDAAGVGISTFPQIVARLISMGFNFGYYYYPGISMTRSDSPWYVTISRHGFNDTLNADPAGNFKNITSKDRSWALKPLPKYMVMGVAPDGISSTPPIYYDFSVMAPCIGCNINLGEQRMAELDLFRGQKMNVPDGFSFGSPSIRLNMLDDEKGSLRKYLMNYQKRCYDMEHNAVVSWRDVIWDIDVVMLRPGPDVDYHFTFYCILQDFDYQFNLEGDGVGNLNIIDMPFSIVGARTNTDKVYASAPPSFLLLNNTTGLRMNDITVSITKPIVKGN